MCPWRDESRFEERSVKGEKWVIILEIAHRKKQGEREELCKLEMLIVAESKRVLQHEGCFIFINSKECLLRKAQ